MPFALLALAACGGGAATPPSSLAGPAPAEAPASPEAATPVAKPAPPPPKRRPYEIHNDCADVVTVVFGDEPKAEGAGSRTLAPGSSIEGPRDADGNQTVWLLDDAGEPLIKVNVTRGMRRVQIGRSCRTLDAR